MKRSLYRFCFIAMLVLVMVAGTSIAAAVDIGIILPTREETRWLGDEAKFLKTIEEGKYDARILFSEKSSAIEKTNVETLLSLGAKTIVLCSYDATASAAAVDIAAEEGATVICYDRLIMDTPNLAYYITFDSVKVGEAQAQYLADQVEAGSKGNNLYMYAGALTDNNSFLFLDGAWNVLQPLIADGTFTVQNCAKAVEFKDKPTLTREEKAAIMSTIDTEWQMDVSKSLAEAHLTAAGPDAKGTVFVLSPADDDCARSLSDAFRADGAVTKLHIVGADGVESSVQYIIDGKQSMTVYKDPQDLVDATFEIIAALKEGRVPETNAVFNNNASDVPTIQCDVVTVTADNIVEVFFEGGVYDGNNYVNWK
jgi:putative multiple sugar transport system substrate-binding protein